MTIKERRERRMREFKEEMDRKKAERERLEAAGDTFMLGLMDIKEEDDLTPYEVFSRQLRLIFSAQAKRDMAKTGICPCCGQNAPLKGQRTCAQ